MIQSSLLQHAKQGDPAAISALMHLVLESRGVTVKVVRIQDCLHISFISERQLSQATLVSFSRKGLERLGVKSIQTVKLYGLKTGEELPIWTEVFCLGDTEAIMSPVSPTQVSPTQSVTAVSVEPQPVARLSSQAVTLYETAMRSWQGLQAQMRQHSNWFEQVKTYRLQVPLEIAFGPSQYIVITIVTLMAFIFGGVLALIANSRPDRLLPQSREVLGEDTISTSKSLPADPQLAIAIQQEDAKHYLSKMNQAQQTFYQNNGRFAKNLEELERSLASDAQTPTSLSFLSNSYAYKLTFPAQTLSQLTATAKVPGLKSFTAIVALSTDATKPPIVAVCVTDQATQVPPETPQLTDGTIRCPVGATQVL